MKIAAYKTVRTGDLITKNQLSSISRRIDAIKRSILPLDPNHFYDSEKLDKLEAELEHLKCVLERSIVLSKRNRLNFRVIQGGSGLFSKGTN